MSTKPKSVTIPVPQVKSNATTPTKNATIVGEFQKKLERSGIIDAIKKTMLTMVHNSDSSVYHLEYFVKKLMEVGGIQMPAPAPTLSADTIGAYEKELQAARDKIRHLEQKVLELQKQIPADDEVSSL